LEYTKFFVILIVCLIGVDIIILYYGGLAMSNSGMKFRVRLVVDLGCATGDDILERKIFAEALVYPEVSGQRSMEEWVEDIMISEGENQVVEMLVEDLKKKFGADYIEGNEDLYEVMCWGEEVFNGVDDFKFAFSNLEYRKIIKDYK
jgi:hypothetical protein